MAIPPSNIERKDEMANFMSNGMDLAQEMSSTPDSELTLEQRIERSLQANHQYQAQRMGMNSHQGPVSSNHRLASGGALVEGVRLAGALPRAPQEIIDQVSVTLGGINLSPSQAYDMYASGQVSEADYMAAVDAALEPYGYQA